MKNLLSILLLSVILSSCSISMISLNKGKIDIPKKETYVVTYQALLDENSSAKISYLDENGEKQKLKSITGNWEKTLTLKSGSKGHIKVTAKGDKAKGAFKVLVDGKVIHEHILTNKKVLYNLSFHLP